MNNRGISPLIATVLLIAFSVALGAVVMSYGESYVEQQATFVNRGTEVSGNACDGVDLQLISIKNVPQLCVKTNTVELSLDNGQSKIDSIQARIVGSNGIAMVPNLLKQPLDAGVPLRTVFAFDDVGAPLQIKLTPILSTESGSEFCAQKAIVVEDIRAC